MREGRHYRILETVKKRRIENTNIGVVEHKKVGVIKRGNKK